MGFAYSYVFWTYLILNIIILSEGVSKLSYSKKITKP